jgi:signal transduction histidine kinase
MFGKDDQVKTEVNLNELIGSVLKLIRPDLRKNRIGLHLSLDVEAKPVLANAVQLQQLILNLVMNAIEAMRSEPSRMLSIASGMSDDQSSVRVSVEDTGSGIDRSNLEEIFRPFFTTKERGMGMGLAICSTIIQKHEGRIWATSCAGGGSVFWFEIPIKSG